LDGVRCKRCAMLASVSPAAFPQDHRSGRAAAAQHRYHMSASGSLRILLVEDEAIIAIMLEGMLADLGCEVVGPAGNLGEATRLAQSEGLGGAFLDVNLGGQSIYPVADLLTARGIPFVFVSGYGAAGIEARFSGAPVLSKPILDADIERAVATIRERCGHSAAS
jgi:CheY-like chemotaxis protein